METPEILLLLAAILISFFVSRKTYITLEKKGNIASLLIATAFFIGTFILIYIAAFIAMIIFGDGFSRR